MSKPEHSILTSNIYNKKKVYTEQYPCYYCISKPVCHLRKLRTCSVYKEEWANTIFSMPVLNLLRNINIKQLIKVQWNESFEEIFIVRDIKLYAFLEDDSIIHLQYDREKWHDYSKREYVSKLGLQGKYNERQHDTIELTCEKLLKDIIHIPGKEHVFL